jgi:tetratricopeptide (TPR) repeat protein
MPFSRFLFAYKIVFIFIACIFLLGSAIPSQEGAGRGRVTGEVLNEKGEPIPDAKVILKSKKFQTTITKTADKNGKWAVVGIQGGPWDIDISAPGYYPKMIATEVSEILRNKPIVIKLEESEETVLSAEEAKEMKKLLTKGSDLFSQKDYEAALQEYQKILTEHPELDRGNLYIGNCYKEMEDMDKAIAAYEIFWEKNKDSFEANLSLADAYVLKSDYEKALPFLEKLEINKITDPAMCYNFGESYFSLGQTDKAIKFFLRALEINAEFADAYYKLGLAYLNKGDVEKSKINLEKFIEMSPDSPNAEIAKEFLKNIEQQ